MKAVRGFELLAGRYEREPPNSVNSNSMAGPFCPSRRIARTCQFVKLTQVGISNFTIVQVEAMRNPTFVAQKL
jgi:hypothetical protein